MALHDHDVGRFNRWSSHYDRSILQHVLFGPVQEATLKEAVREANDVNAVLDIGCGTGRLLRRIARQYPGAELVGVDPAPGMVRQAQSQGSSEQHVEFVNAQAEKLPFPDASFDLVFTTVSFHHWADQSQGLNEVRRVLRNEGLFVLTDVMASGLFGRFLARRHVRGRFHSPGSLDEILRASRLHTVRRVSAPWPWQIKITVARGTD